jgi:catechol-2,3-dioxygenase
MTTGSLSGSVRGVGVNGLCELALETDDPEGLAAFYAGLGLDELLRENGRIWLAVGPNARLGIWPPGEMEHHDRGGRHIHFALSVTSEALESVAAMLDDRGIDVEGPVEHEGGDRSIYFSDPAGNRVELWDFFEDGDGAAMGAAAFSEEA